MHVVFGVTGRVGGETARTLIGQGESVRVVVRRIEQGAPWAALGAQVVVASLDDADAVCAALKGASSAFLLNPTSTTGNPFEQAAVIGAALASAVQRASLPKAVVLSSIGAQHAAGVGVIATLHQIEAALAGLVPEMAFLRPGYFIETWSEVADSAFENGVLPTFLEPDQKIPMVSTIDVGKAAATLLGEERWTGTRVVELSGPDDWSAREVAMAFSAVLGRSVDPLFVPAQQRAAALAEAGVSTAFAEALLGMYEGLANGRVSHRSVGEHRRGGITLATAIERIVMHTRSAANVMEI